MDKKKVISKTTKAAALALACITVVGTASAYLTDAETASNVFTLGEVKVDLTEPNYPGNDSNDVKDLVPNQEVKKDPTVTNTGDNNAVVFLKVKVPTAEVITAKNDGTKEASAEKELFIFKDSSDSIVTKENHFDDKWIPLTTVESTENASASGDFVYHIFGYSEILEPGETTAALFDKVQLINVIEGQIDNSTQKIDIDAYAIQDANILSATGEIDLSVIDRSKLEEIYQIFFNQNKADITAGNIKDANTNNKLDLSGAQRP